MGPTARSFGALLLCALLGNCGRASETELRGEPAGWLAACRGDADCGEGSCVCGVCTATCAEDDCSAGPPGSACIAPGHAAHAGFCAGRSTAPICLAPCSETSECDGADRCIDSVCVPEAAADVLAPRSGPLCATNPVVPRSLLVTVQTQLDRLAGCEVIQGDLTLVLQPNADTSVLASLREVTGKLDVSGQSLPSEVVQMPEFPSLQAAGELSLGELDLGGMDRMPALRALTRVNVFEVPDAWLRIAGCSGMTDLRAFADVEGIIGLELIGNPDLTALSALQNAGRLQYLYLQSNERLTALGGLGDTSGLRDVQITQNHALTSLEGLVLPAHLEQLILAYDSSLQTLAGLGQLESIGYSNISENTSLVSLEGVTRLREVGELLISSNPVLEGFGSWPAIEHIGSCNIHGNPAWRTMAGLAAVTMSYLDIMESGLTDASALDDVTVYSGMSLWNNAQLVTLNGAPTLGADATLTISESPHLTDLSGLSRLTRLRRIALSKVGVESLDALSSLEQLSEIDLEWNPNLIQIDGLARVSGLVSLRAHVNAALERLPSFPNVTEIPSMEQAGYGSLSIEIVENASLVEGPSFPALTEAMTIDVRRNPSLTRLLGFARLESVGTLEIVSNHLLAEVNFGSLERADFVRVDNNPLLTMEQLAPLLPFMAGAESTPAENP